MESREVVQQHDFFGDMPADVIALICHLLIPSDIVALLRVCRATHAAILTFNIGVMQKLWEAKLALHFPHADTYDLKSAAQFHQAFGRHYQAQVQLPADATEKLYLKRFFETAKEGDVKNLELIVDHLDKSDIYLHELQSYAFQEDTDNHTFLFYARKFKRQEWLDRCHQLISKSSLPMILESKEYVFIVTGGDKLRQIVNHLAIHKPLSIFQEVAREWSLISTESDKDRLLRLAMRYGHLSFVKWFLNINTQIKPSIHNYLKDALQSHSIVLVSFLLDESRDEQNEDNNRNVLVDAVTTRQVSLVKLVLEKRFPSSEKIENLLMRGLLNKLAVTPAIYDCRIYNLLYDMLSSEVVATLNVNLLLSLAAQNGNVAYIREWSRRDPDLFNRSMQQMLLFEFIRGYNGCLKKPNNYDAVAMYRLCKDAPRHEDGLCYHSIMGGMPFEFLEYLINTGERAGYQDDEGGNILHLLARTPSYNECNVGPIIKLLVDNGVDIERQAKGVTPLMLARWQGNINIAKAFVEQGARVDYLTVDGIYSIYTIVSAGNQDVSKTLLFHLAIDDKAKIVVDAYLACQVKDITKRHVLRGLLDYIYDRRINFSYISRSIFFIPFGEKQELEAADALIRVIVHGEGLQILDAHQSALNQGKLGKLFNSAEMRRVLGLPSQHHEAPRHHRASLFNHMEL